MLQEDNSEANESEHLSKHDTPQLFTAVSLGPSCIAYVSALIPRTI